MLDGVQARLLLQAIGLLLMPVGLAWSVQAFAGVYHFTRHTGVFQSPWPGQQIIEHVVLTNLGGMLWCVISALVAVAGARLFFAGGRLFGPLVRRLAR